jgi:hypothetical protein
MSEWIRREIKKYKGEKITLPHLSSALKIVDKKVAKEISKNYLGSYIGLGNNIQRNDRGVSLLSSTGVQGNAKVSLSITHDNFHKIISGFTSRKIVEPNWINEKDEYLAPKESHEEYQQFTIDAVVYSLFNNSSEQSSLRQVEYKDQLWDIKNEFFWMSVEKMKELADQNGYDELYNDARTSSDRYVHKLLFGEEKVYDKLSPDAKLVLDKATELVEKSMELRQVMANDENHLNSWDAGYAQLKLVWKEYFQEDFKEFRQLYKNLEDRMRPLVYELGFLKK